jgi:hypothetical protein
VYYTVYVGNGNFSEWIGFGEATIIHILIFNIDVPQRTTELTIYSEKDVIASNDGGCGTDAGGTFAGAHYLDPEYYNSSGRLFFGDIADFYKFYANEGDNISLKIRNLRLGNTSFILYAPNGFIELISADYITQDLEFVIPANYTGYYIMRFYKDAYDTICSKYYFDLEINQPITTSNQLSTQLISLISTGVSIIGVMIILRKKRNH